MRTHNPRQVVEDIRSHLAAHDRPVAFLFGAGTSSSVNIAPLTAPGKKPTHQPLIPGIADLTEICGQAVQAMGVREGAAWKMLVKQCEQATRPCNIESILSHLRLKIDAISDGEQLLDLDAQRLSAIERTICSAIAKIACPREDTIPKQTAHNDFAAWVKKVNRTAPLELFTTNYDILFERAFERARVPVFDAFVGTNRPFFYPECLDEEVLLPPATWIRLWKLHGSVNWQKDNSTGSTRIIRTSPTDSGEMIFPSHLKYDESRKLPYLAYRDRLTRILSTKHALLLTCGYSFADKHINELLYSAVESRTETNIIALQFNDLEEHDALVVDAIQRPRLTVVGPNGGVISGIWGRWRLTQPVDGKTWSFMDLVFDSKAQPEDETVPTAEASGLSGIMRLGDFNRFSRFLSAMAPDPR